LVEEVDLVKVNPMFARVRYPGGREVSVNLCDLARCPGDFALRPTPGQRSRSESLDLNGEDAEGDFCLPRKL